MYALNLMDITSKFCISTIFVIIYILTILYTMYFACMFMSYHCTKLDMPISRGKEQG